MIYDVGAEIRAEWVFTFVSTSKATTQPIETLHRMDVFDFFTLLKTIKRNDK